MLNQFEDMVVTKIVEQLNKHGINVNSETVKKAIENSPQIIVQIEAILATSDNQEKLAKIKALLQSASNDTNLPNDSTQGK